MQHKEFTRYIQWTEQANRYLCNVIPADNSFNNELKYIQFVVRSGMLPDVYSTDKICYTDDDMPTNIIVDNSIKDDKEWLAI
jgi:hypothetical protein